MIAYHIHHGSLDSWYSDTIVSALTLTDLAFIDRPGYLHYALHGLRQAVSLNSFDAAINGLFWVAIVLAAPALGILILTDLVRHGDSGPSGHALPFLAVFYGVVSAHFQIPIYLFYTIGLSLAGLIWMLAGKSMRRRAIIGACALLLSVAGLYYHAGQPLSRGLIGTIEGVRSKVTPAVGLDRLGLSIESNDIKLYRHLTDLVNREVRDDQTILAMPVNPEIYFITGRRAPVRFFNSALGIVDNSDLRAVMQTMRNRPPRLVFHRPADKYNTELGDQVMAYVRLHYDLLETRGGFKIYRYRD